MARRTSTFMIGLFVTIGIIIGVGAIIWVGASRYFEKGALYVTYFDESVQGLQKDSVVRYRGVDVGRVTSIEVAPDNRLIAATMKIDLTGELEKNAVAQLRAVGLTGIVFIELDRRDMDKALATPRIDFPAPYPIIPSKPSEVRQILEGIDRIIDKFDKVDFEGISNQVITTARSADAFLTGNQMNKIMANLESSTTTLNKSMAVISKITAKGDLEKILTEARETLKDTRMLITALRTDLVEKINQVDFQGMSTEIKGAAKAANTLMSGKQMARILANMESTTAAVEKSVTRLDKIIAQGSLENTMTEARQTLTEMRALVTGLNNEVKAMKLADTAEKANHLISSLDARSGVSAVNIQMATENLRSASESLERLMERLEAHPSELIFGK